jgi:hypothetical protein
MRRRAEGRREINSVWFWGGGFIPEAAPHDAFQTIYSDDPVSRGLAIINDCRCLDQAAATTADLAADGPSVFVDWTIGGAGPEQELALVEELAAQLLTRADRGALNVSVYDGSGLGREYGASVRSRFWRRRRPLSRILPSGSEE